MPADSTLTTNYIHISVSEFRSRPHPVRLPPWAWSWILACSALVRSRVLWLLPASVPFISFASFFLNQTPNKSERAHERTPGVRLLNARNKLAAAPYSPAPSRPPGRLRAPTSAFDYWLSSWSDHFTIASSSSDAPNWTQSMRFFPYTLWSRLIHFACTFTSILFQLETFCVFWFLFFFLMKSAQNFVLNRQALVKMGWVKMIVFGVCLYAIHF